MKTKVLKFLQKLPKTPEEQFNEAFKLYQKTEGNSFSQIRYLNAAGFTKSNLDNLLYELKKCNKITDAEIRAAVMKANPLPLANPYTIPAFRKGTPGNRERQAFCKEHKIEANGKSNKILDSAIAKWTKEMADKWTKEQAEAEKDKKEKISSTAGTGVDNIDVNDEIVVTETTKEEVFTGIPAEARDYVSLLDEFPFLEKDDCPEELKILVSDKRKHYHRYIDARKKLLVVATEAGPEAPMTNEQIFDLAVQAVDNWEANQAIYAELDHYNKENKILGEHPIFIERKLKESVDKMTIPEAIKRKSNLDNYILRNSKSLNIENDKVSSEGRDENVILKLSQKIEAWKIELSLVNNKLGVSEK